MIGAIAGDIIGSIYERNPVKSTEFPLFSDPSTFTDDTVLTIASAYTILNKSDYAESFRKFGSKYPNACYGGIFYNWLFSSGGPYNSWGNGSAMRASPVGFAFGSVKEVLGEAKRSAKVTHDHPDGVKTNRAS